MTYQLATTKKVDLAFHVDELRDSDGKWTASPETLFKSAMKLKADADAVTQREWTKQTGSRVSLMDDPNRLLDLPHNSLQAWGGYQIAGIYQAMNKRLREGDNPKLDNYWTKNWLSSFGDLGKMVENMKKAFDDYGMTTDTPLKTYRGLTDDGTDWDKVLSIGSTYTDNGVISTAPVADEVGGFLDPDEVGTRGDPAHAVILEIHMPSGTRVLGTSQESSELMLKPGARFRVVSKGLIAVRNKKDGPRVKYRKIVVEIVP